MTDPAAGPSTVTTPGTGAARKLRFHVLRHDPRDPSSVPHTDVFEIEEAAGMTLFIALNEIRETLDASASAAAAAW
jgi:fumarate reductase iron-sulfur subunit